jgi:hypothetical protein
MLLHLLGAFFPCSQAPKSRIEAVLFKSSNGHTLPSSSCQRCHVRLLVVCQSLHGELGHYFISLGALEPRAEPETFLRRPRPTFPRSLSSPSFLPALFGKQKRTMGMRNTSSLGARGESV